jgi:hypothetical protein
MVLGLIENSNIKFYLFQIGMVAEQLWHFTAKAQSFLISKVL